MMRKIAVVTVGRSDYGIERPILRRITADASLELQLIVGGMHLAPEFGQTVRAIEEDGFPIVERVELTIASDSPAGIGVSMGVGTVGFARAYDRLRPDLVLVVGDRFEMHAAAVAAVPFRLPIAHAHGGELTEGAIDDAFRHSMTKLSHLHFVSAQDAAQRVRQMGEEPWRITVSGAPALDELRAIAPLSRQDLEARLGIPIERPLIVTFHPVTLEFEQAEAQARELVAALAECAQPMVITGPNADTNGRAVRAVLQEFAASHPAARFVENLGTQAYGSLMRLAAAMVGNSSSGIVEAATFELPVVNVGTRQHGRLRAANVLDVGYGRHEILAGIQRATRPEFRAELLGLTNPYGDGLAAERIVSRLKSVTLNDALIRKRFAPLEAGEPASEKPEWSHAA